jgi:hypothetical protein
MQGYFSAVFSAIEGAKTSSNPAGVEPGCGSPPPGRHAAIRPRVGDNNDTICGPKDGTGTSSATAPC